MPMKLATAVPLTDAVGPAEIPSSLAAAFDRLGTASVVFKAICGCGMPPGSLEPLLGAASGAFVPGAPLLLLPRKSATTDGPSKALMKLTLHKAVDGTEAGSASVDFSSTGGSRTVVLETRRIVRNCSMSTFGDITNQRDVELRLSGGLSAGLLQSLNDS